MTCRVRGQIQYLEQVWYLEAPANMAHVNSGHNGGMGLALDGIIWTNGGMGLVLDGIIWTKKKQKSTKIKSSKT